MDRFLTRRRPPPTRKRRPDDRRLVRTTTTSSSDDVLLVQKLLRALPLPWPELSRICRPGHHQPNLLYRSDSFKFERFQPPQGGNDASGPPSQISLQDDYSVPIDLIAHTHPDTLLDTNTRWLTGKRYGQTIQIIDTYSDPKDSKTYLHPAEDNRHKEDYYTNYTRNYSLPYTDYSSHTDSQPDNDNHCDVIIPAYSKSRRHHSSRSAGRLERAEVEEEQEEEEEQEVDNCYYSSAHRRRTRPAGSSSRSSHNRKAEEEKHKRYEKAELDEQQRRYARSTTGRKEKGDKNHQQEQSQQFNSEQRRRTPYYYGDLLNADGGGERGGGVECSSSRNNWMPPSCVAAGPPPHAAPPSPPLPLMSRLYETAFDCRVSRSDDEQLEVDLVTHRSLLQSSPSSQSQLLQSQSQLLQSQSQLPQSQSQLLQSQKQLQQPVVVSHYNRATSQRLQSQLVTSSARSTNLQGRQEDDDQEEMLGQELSRLGLSGCPPSAPASAPLPAKFPSAHAHGRPSHHRHHHHHHSRLKDIRLPIKSLRSRTNDSRALEGRPDDEKKRAASKSKMAGGGGGGVEVVTGGVPRTKYSSSESMATTSSSGGSLESIRSSTSDGNRSTTSSDSQASSSLSSHSSDNRAGGGGTRPRLACESLSLNLLPLSSCTSRSLHLQHILSPISDKSGHEPNSETSDNNRNNNSQGTPDDVSGGGICSPTGGVAGAATGQLQLTSADVCVAAVETTTTKSSKWRRTTTAQNRNVARLAPDAEALQAGSDSGISIECPPAALKPDASQLDLADLPFDMPKLRRRRLQQVESCSGDMSHDKSRRKPQSPQQPPQPQSLDLSHLDSGSTTSVDVRVGDVPVPFDMPKLRRRGGGQSQLALAADSGSTTSVDLGDLPFDMPKLRRRQRMSLPIATASTSSAAAGSSSSQHEFTDHRVSRPGLTLDLNSSLGGASCSSAGMHLDLDETSSAALGEAIDVNIPLEKQGWYHGVITRFEAENVLRSHREGSYLVRNSESSRNDYSLSLKSARGFMHMRIQLCAESGKYILGQFSSPFATIPDMIQNYTVSRLPIRGAEHMCLLHPVIEQLL